MHSLLKKLKKNHSPRNIHKAQFLLSLCMGICFLYAPPSYAKVVAVAPEITNYQLQCDEVFACPAVIDRRVDFWITVFHKWKKQNRVLHDSRRPERVYMVLDTEDMCRRKNPKGEVKSGLKVVKKRLDELANLISSGAGQARLKKHPYYKLFPNADVKYIKAGKDSIRCQSGNRELFSEALNNFQIYKPYVLDALTQQNLPKDIQYLPFVESSYNPKAFSFAGAAGMWQIMPSTARSLGLQLGTSVDERLEPEFATLAAAKYFRESIDRLSKTAEEGNHSILPKDINPFVITSYNYGVRGMQRAIDQVGTDYERLLKEYKSRSFQIAVRNFYASFLAARHVAQNQTVFFPELQINPVVPKVDRIVLPKPLTAKQILSSLNIPKKQLQELNPGITYRVWKNQRAVPTGYQLKVPFRDEGWQSEAAQLQRLKGVTQGSGSGDSGRRHKVRKGQTACGIAQRYKVRCKDLISLNKLNRKAVVKIGQRLKIPGGVQKYRETKIVKASQELRERLASQTIVNSNLTETDKASAGNLSDQSINTAQALSLEKPVDIDIQIPKLSDIKESEHSVSGNVVASESRPVKTEKLPIESQPNNQPEKISTSRQENKPVASKVVNLDTKIYQTNGRYWVKALPSESIGLYADWSGIGTTRKIRQLNKLSGKAQIKVFQKVFLPKFSEQTKSDFQLNRNEYHLELQLQYFQRFVVSKVIQRSAKKNETMWSIAKNNRIPMWLLMQYNPQIRAGSKIRIPIIKPKGK